MFGLRILFASSLLGIAGLVACAGAGTEDSSASGADFSVGNDAGHVKTDAQVAAPSLAPGQFDLGTPRADDSSDVHTRLILANDGGLPTATLFATVGHPECGIFIEPTGREYDLALVKKTPCGATVWHAHKTTNIPPAPFSTELDVTITDNRFLTCGTADASIVVVESFHDEGTPVQPPTTLLSRDVVDGGH